MKVAYLDCSTGISGDMTLAALMDAGVDAEAIRAAIDSLNLPGVELQVTETMKGGFRAKYVRVEHPEQHAHRHLSHVTKIIDAATGLTNSQRELAMRIFEAVAAAEAKVHGSTIEKVHFHEVGAIDSIVDIVGAAVAFDLLGADEVVCSPLPTGRGRVSIDHGICPVPTPGTAELLRGIPLQDVPVEAELTTPTGAAIVKTVVDRFGPLPEMTIDAIGYGAGTMDLPDRGNLLRVFVGTAVTSPLRDQVDLLETNLDDVSGEVIGHTKQLLLEAGALDVYSVPIQMKKDRPGCILSVLSRPEKTDGVLELLFRETGTLGVRRQRITREKQYREACTVPTPWGEVEGKRGWRPGGIATFAPEFESCAKVAREHGLPLREVYRAALAAFDGSAATRPVEAGEPAAGHGHGHDHDHDHDHDHG